MAKSSIKQALQLGSSLLLANGEQVSVLGACKLRQLEDVMELYQKFTLKSLKFAGLFMRGNEDARDAMLQLLYIMSDEKVSTDEWLDKLTTADEKAVYEAIHRFLGFEFRNAGKTTDEQ